MPASFMNLRAGAGNAGLSGDNLGGKDEDMEEGLGLGELAQLTVNNEADVTYDVRSLLLFCLPFLVAWNKKAGRLLRRLGH